MRDVGALTTTDPELIVREIGTVAVLKAMEKLYVPACAVPLSIPPALRVKPEPDKDPVWIV
jgi:hypothetical protein